MLAHPTILLAEDDKDDQETLLRAFKKITDSHHLAVVDNGKELVHFLAQLEDDALPCLIVLDFNMPELNGKETLIILQSHLRYQHIPTIIFTTSESRKEMEDCISIGAKDYMIKPSNIQDIVRSAKKMLDYCDNREN